MLRLVEELMLSGVAEVWKGPDEEPHRLEDAEVADEVQTTQLVVQLHSIPEDERRDAVRGKMRGVILEDALQLLVPGEHLQRMDEDEVLLEGDFQKLLMFRSVMLNYLQAMGHFGIGHLQSVDASHVPASAEAPLGFEDVRFH
eukprot:gb/GECG01012947.1/.p1 GENE.gb/GECG01012947.1/~~gb/GECG01012947.1/.p1  ORF type:complete len:143 (+),score=14.59 gb/GECG01012947.1/:1-429(+)